MARGAAPRLLLIAVIAVTGTIACGWLPALFVRPELRNEPSYSLPDPALSPGGREPTRIRVLLVPGPARAVAFATRVRTLFSHSDGSDLPLTSLNPSAAEGEPVPAGIRAIVAREFARHDRGDWTIVVAGWPWPAWVGARSSRGSWWAIPLSDTSPVRPHRRLIPLKPLFVGFASNAGVLMLGLAGVTELVRYCRRHARLVAGRCARCGFDLVGLSATSQCPECGFRRPQH